jgi:predicted Rossmann fold nucleotide-binding protein DprA/Smf involved in DNA uptake
MTDRSMAITTLCSHLCVGEGVSPLEPKEYTNLALLMNKKNIMPESLLFFNKNDFLEKLEVTEKEAERLLRLIDRSASLSFEISKYENMGISIVTRADSTYPENLKKKLKTSCPPLFYVAGDISLLNCKAVGYVGSRSIGEKDISFTKSTVQKTLNAGYAVVSGGAKGTDSVAEEYALSNDGIAIAYLSDSMLRKLRNPQTIQAIQQKKLLLLSVSKPTAGFNVGVAMMRNKYIYAQSDATVVIKSDYNKGGTWAGAIENLKNKNRALTLCWNHLSYPGNKTLIEKGAIPIDEEWDGDVAFLLEQNANLMDVVEQEINIDEPKPNNAIQLSLFDD